MHVVDAAVRPMSERLGIRYLTLEDLTLEDLCCPAFSYLELPAEEVSSTLSPIIVPTAARNMVTPFV